jgi:hypothetical protein
MNDGSFFREGVRMDRPIAYDKLAREERFVRMRARDVAQLKIDQGLPPFPDLGSRESIKERVHGIMVGEMQAMEGAGRSVYDFPDAPWEFTMDMARQVWDESATWRSTSGSSSTWMAMWASTRRPPSSGVAPARKTRRRGWRA